jgi:hypothetical protein
MFHPMIDGGAKVSVIATSREEAMANLENHFFFNQDAINGYLFELIDLYAINMPEGFEPEVNEIMIEDSKGRQWSKLF